jgi:hypothetical protein
MLAIAESQTTLKITATRHTGQPLGGVTTFRRENK